MLTPLAQTPNTQNARSGAPEPVAEWPVAASAGGVPGRSGSAPRESFLSFFGRTAEVHAEGATDAVPSGERPGAQDTDAEAAAPRSDAADGAVEPRGPGSDADAADTAIAQREVGAEEGAPTVAGMPSAPRFARHGGRDDALVPPADTAPVPRARPARAGDGAHRPAPDESPRTEGHAVDLPSDSPVQPSGVAGMARAEKPPEPLGGFPAASGRTVEITTDQARSGQVVRGAAETARPGALSEGEDRSRITEDAGRYRMSGSAEATRPPHPADVQAAPPYAAPADAGPGHAAAPVPGQRVLATEQSSTGAGQIPAPQSAVQTAMPQGAQAADVAGGAFVPQGLRPVGTQAHPPPRMPQQTGAPARPGAAPFQRAPQTGSPTLPAPLAAQPADAPQPAPPQRSAAAPDAARGPLQGSAPGPSQPAPVARQDTRTGSAQPLSARNGPAGAPAPMTRVTDGSAMPPPAAPASGPSQPIAAASGNTALPQSPQPSRGSDLPTGAAPAGDMPAAGTGASTAAPPARPVPGIPATALASAPPAPVPVAPGPGRADAPPHLAGESGILRPGAQPVMTAGTVPPIAPAPGQAAPADSRGADPRAAEVRDAVALRTAPPVQFGAGERTVQPGAPQLDPLSEKPAITAAEAQAVTEPRALRDVPEMQARSTRAEVARHVAIQIAEAVRSGERPVELTLNPAELGRVRISLGGADGAMTVLVSAERGETLDLMRRHIDQLAQEFRAIGYRGTDFAFERQGGGMGGESPARGRGASGTGDRAEPGHDIPQAGAAPPATPRPGVSDRLDIRV